MAQSIGNDNGLQDWAETLFSVPTNGKTATGPTSVTRMRSVNEELKKELLKILLEVYMSDKLVFFCMFRCNKRQRIVGHFFRQTDRAAHLLNAQAINLDVLDVRLDSFLKTLFRPIIYLFLGYLTRSFKLATQYDVLIPCTIA